MLQTRSAWWSLHIADVFAMEEQVPVKYYTVIALFLHAVVLLGFAALTYLEAVSSPPYSLASGTGYFLSAITGGFGIVAVWLTGEHHSESIRPSRLKMWGGFHVVLLLFPIVVFMFSFITSPSLLIMTILSPYLILIIPPLLIIVLADKESP